MAAPSSPPIVRPFAVTLLLLSSATLAFSLWANLSWEIQDPRNLKFIPPFIEGVDRNMNKHLGAEYLSIAQAIVKGRGFSDPFQVESGPTAWMPPMLCWIEAMFLWLFQGDLELLMVAMIILQNLALMATAALMLIVLGATSRIWVGGVFILGIWFHFRYAFQMTHDCGYLMLIMVGLVAGLGLGQPFAQWNRSAIWGLFGGLATLSSPVIGFVWVVASMIHCKGQWTRFLAAVGVMILVLAPWTLRNYAVFGKIIPVKSNLAYELYQTQCLQEAGVLNPATFGTHPWGNNNTARRDYVTLGENEFLQQKKHLFIEAVRQNPLDFLRRIGERAIGVTLCYPPDHPFLEQQNPLTLFLTYLVYPLPFLGWLFLLYRYVKSGLSHGESVILWVYLLYFLPYIIISYYSRYEFPALPIKWILVAWLGSQISAWFANARIPGGAEDVPGDQP